MLVKYLYFIEKLYFHKFYHTFYHMNTLYRLFLYVQFFCRGLRVSQAALDTAHTVVATSIVKSHPDFLSSYRVLVCSFPRTGMQPSIIGTATHL